MKLKTFVKNPKTSDDLSEDPEVKREKLIYFYGPEDNLERGMSFMLNILVFTE